LLTIYTTELGFDYVGSVNIPSPSSDYKYISILLQRTSMFKIT
jgi:hypothetical protein